MSKKKTEEVTTEEVTTEEVTTEEVTTEEVVEDKGPKMGKKISRKIEETDTITILAESNPKRPSSAAYIRFDGYLTDPAPTTVKEAIDNGVSLGDLSYDVIHGFISIEGVEVTEYEITPRGSVKAEAETEEVTTEAADDANADAEANF